MSARVLMIADRDFSTREHDLLERVEHGVQLAGHIIARAVPRGVKVWDTTALRAMVEFDDSAGFMRPCSAPDAILEALQDDGADKAFVGSSPVDVVHAWGGGSYRVALDIARSCGASLVLDYSSEFAAPRLRKLRRGVQELSREPASRVCVLAADDSLAERARSNLPEADVRTLGWGVPSRRKDEARDESAPRSISVMCTGRSRRDVIQTLRAISEIRETHENMIVFLDEQALDSNASIHRHVESLGLEDCLSVIGNMESARDLILETDVLVAPDTRHEHRSLLLEAIANAMGVVVREGCFLDTGGGGAGGGGAAVPCVDARGGVESARDAILECFDEGDESVERAALAKSFIREHHDVRAHHKGILEAYESVIGAASVPIGTG